jgi:hypothetical protein
LKIESNFARGSWEVFLRQGQVLAALDPRAEQPPKFGKMGLQRYLVDRPGSCQPLLVSVDFERKGGERTWIDELRF